jgi:hypothetical protein
VVKIVGTEWGDQGRTCEEHLINCGEVLVEDVVAGDARVCDTAERQQFHRNHVCCLAAIITCSLHCRNE